MQEKDNFRVFEDLTAEGQHNETLAQTSVCVFVVQSVTNSSLKSLPLCLRPRLPYLCGSRESKPQGLSWIQRVFGSQLAPVTVEGSV